MENKEITQDNTFTIVNDEGKEIKCEVLFTYEDEKTKKNYIAYTDNTLDEEGNTIHGNDFPTERCPLHRYQ